MAWIVTLWRPLFIDVSKDRSAVSSESCQKMMAMRSLEMSVGNYQSARRNMPESFNYRTAFSYNVTTANCNNLKDKVANPLSRGSVESQGKKVQAEGSELRNPARSINYFVPKNMQKKPSVQPVRGLFQEGIKWPGREVDLPPPPSTWVNNKCSHITTPPIYMTVTLS
jgi:hypothetical protein